MSGETTLPEQDAEAGSSDLTSLLLLEMSRFFGQRPPGAQPSAFGSAEENPLSDTEDALPTMEARYRVLVEQIPAVVFMAFIDGGIGEAYVSPQIEKLLGFTREEWLDDPIRWYQQIHPDDRTRWSMEAAEMMSTGNALKSIYRVIARDGRVVWFHCEAKLVRHKNGHPWFIHGVGFDITALKQTEHALQQEIAERERLQKLEMERQIARTEQTESRLAAIVESSGDAIISKDLDGTITSWNAAATRLFGYAAEEIMGKSILVLFPPERLAEEMEILARLSKGERVEYQDTQLVTKRGELLDVSETISPIADRNGRVIGASRIVRDIGERKRSEEKLRITEKLAAAGRLAASIAHEVNNPLEAVTNLLYLARMDQAIGAETHQYLDRANEELIRVAHITRQTLGFYHDSSFPLCFHVSEAIEGVLAIYARRMAGRNITLEKRMDASLEILAFPGEFRQVISNLVANAIDAMGRRGGRLMVRACRQHGPRGAALQGVRICVADTGAGIPTAHRARIFEAFYTTKETTGTGLGLWLSRAIVQKHGGTIQVRSWADPPKSGTVFLIFWPVEPAEKLQNRERMDSQEAL